LPVVGETDIRPIFQCTFDSGPQSFVRQLSFRISELLPRPEGRGFSAAYSVLCHHSPLASGHVLREFSVFCFIGPNLHQIRGAEVQTSSDRFGVFPPYYCCAYNPTQRALSGRRSAR
jgi:hypothetical protein